MKTCMCTTGLIALIIFIPIVTSAQEALNWYPDFNFLFAKNTVFPRSYEPNYAATAPFRKTILTQKSNSATRITTDDYNLSANCAQTLNRAYDDAWRDSFVYLDNRLAEKWMLTAQGVALKATYFYAHNQVQPDSVVTLADSGVVKKVFYHYNVANKVDTAWLQYPHNGQFYDAQMAVYDYDVLGNLTRFKLNERFLPTNSWVLTQNDLILYNRFNKIEKYTLSDFTAPNNAFSDEFQFVYDSEGNFIRASVRDVNHEYGRFQPTQFAANRSVLELTYTELAGSHWENRYRYQFDYDVSARLTNVIGQDWEGVWATNYRKTYQYCGTTVAVNVAQEVDKIRVSPNPFSSDIQFDTEGGHFGKTSVEIYDLTGQLILNKKEECNTSARVNLTLPTTASGVYFYRISCEKGTQTGKVVKL